MNPRRRRHARYRRALRRCPHPQVELLYGFPDAGWRQTTAELVVGEGDTLCRVPAGTWIHVTGARLGVMTICRRCSAELAFTPDME